MARNEPWEGTGPSGILVFVTQPDTGGSPCAFPATIGRTGALGLRGYSRRQRLLERRGLRPLALAQVEQPPPVPPGVVYDGSDRARPCKTQLDVTLCFAPLLRWVLTWWRSGRLALAIDPTLKGDQTTAIGISVLYRGCAIPVAWSIHRATQRGSWMDPTVELLKELAPAVP